MSNPAWLDWDKFLTKADKEILVRYLQESDLTLAQKEILVRRLQEPSPPTEKIMGYRELSSEDLDLINEAKALAESVGDFCHRLSIIPAVDQRWLAIARTELQKAFMCLVRAVAKPESF